eukprot:FR739627.1.p1 GENE.FR739627.1~~FR739627.1.p1  ORF type:complete len:212 (+),score=33.41 FR739627.1:55-636(+)
MVAASCVTTALINLFKVEALVFTGVAGGLTEALKVGDIVVASHAINYDMDVTAFTLPWQPDYKHQRGELPFTNWRDYEADPHLLTLATNSTTAAAGASDMTVKVGRIATGSEFVTVPRKIELKATWDLVGNPDAVEMECAGVAQVCKMYQVPFLGLRAISDTITGDANADFGAFCQEAADNLWPIVESIVAQW